MVSDFNIAVEYNPPGDGNCQFNAIAHQLVTLGIFRSVQTLRKDVIKYFSEHNCLGDRINSVSWNQSLVLESRAEYLQRMSREFEYGDQITLQAVAEIYNVQLIVVSPINHATALISPDGSNIFRMDIPYLVLGHYPEGFGEHYVSIAHDFGRLMSIIAEAPQIRLESDVVTEESANISRHNISIQEITESHAPQLVNHAPKFVNLPLEILSLIAGFCMEDDLTAQDTLRKVHPNLAQAVEISLNSKTPPELYINDGLQTKLNVQKLDEIDISVQKLIRTSGKNSGLSDTIRKLVSNPRWIHAWLRLKRTNTRPGWFVVTAIMWKN